MDSNIYIIRHGHAAYPDDRLTDEGINVALSLQEAFTIYQLVISSPLLRAKQTAEYLGLMIGEIHENLRELELESVNAPTADAYVLTAHEQEPAEVQLLGKIALSVINEIASRGKETLIVSHNLTMSALYHQLTGEITSFANFKGFKIIFRNGTITSVNKDT